MKTPAARTAKSFVSAPSSRPCRTNDGALRIVLTPRTRPNPIMVFPGPRGPRQTLPSPSRPCAMGSGKKGSPLLVLGGPADGLQIHEGIVEFGHVAERADGPFGADPHGDFDVQEILRQHAVFVGSASPHPLLVDAHTDPFDERLHPRGGLDRTLQRRCGRGR